MSTVIQIVNDKIIEQLQKGIIPWHKPWVGPRGAYSVASGRPYSLLNQMLLGLPGPYATYDQWKKIGGQVRKAEKGHMVIFWDLIEKKIIDDNGDETVETKPVLRYYKVFHHSQVDGIDHHFEERISLPPKPIEAADKLITNYIAREKIIYKEDETSNQAYYSPLKDMVVIPARQFFKTTYGLYGTIFHELAHSTGSRSRLNRPGLEQVSFGSTEYSLEELIAELTSSYLLESLGISTDDSFQNSAAYLYNWIQAIRKDEKMIIRSAPAAERAARYILGTL